MTPVRGMVLLAVLWLAGCGPMIADLPSGLTDAEIIHRSNFCTDAGFDALLIYGLTKDGRPQDVMCEPRRVTITEDKPK